VSKPDMVEQRLGPQIILGVTKLLGVSCSLKRLTTASANLGIISSVPIIFVLGFSMYIVMPVVIVWGWLRWKKRTQPRNIFSTLSLIGFTFVTASGLLAVFSIVYAIAFRFRFYDHRFSKSLGWAFYYRLWALSSPSVVHGDQTRCVGTLPLVLRECPCFGL